MRPLMAATASILCNSYSFPVSCFQFPVKTSSASSSLSLLSSFSQATFLLHSISSFSPFSLSTFSPSSHRLHRRRPSFRSQFGSTRSQNEPDVKKTLFPGGFKRAEIKVPTLILQLEVAEVLEGGDALRFTDAAVSEMVSMVVLNGGDESAGRIYEAALALKRVLRGSSYLLISERVDIASAVGANGVVLSDQGLPAIIARNMMMESKSESIVLPLVARTVTTTESALSASNSEGADFLIFAINNEKDVEMLSRSVVRNVKVPVFTMINSLESSELHNGAAKLLQSGASGLVISSHDMQFRGDVYSQLLSSAILTEKGNQEELQSPEKIKLMNGEDFHANKTVDGITKIEDIEKQIIEAERPVLLEAIDFIRKTAPQMEEISLLVDAVARLDEPFLLVIVGEFNSGKSTVINALLGRKYMEDGVVPTTNEITLLCYSGSGSNDYKRCERHPDGQYICYLPSPVLKDMNLVDTPGTNVILQRQQRLTEEFVPRADLLLFIISADRPLTESEVNFLRYVQQWKKKVVFILNKSDLYQNSSELEEATRFISENAQKLLSADSVTLYPVSARSALQAKVSATGDDGQIDQEIFSSDLRWKTSGFYELEQYLFSFLDTSTDMGMERMRLKLETPIGIACTLLAACERQVIQECEKTKKDLILVNKIVGSVKEYANKMESESTFWKKQALSLVDTAKARAENLINSTLRLSNIDMAASYMFRGEEYSSIPAASKVQNEILGTALSDAQKLLVDYSTWLDCSNAREGMQYTQIFEKEWPGFVFPEGLTLSEKNQLLDRREEHSIKVLEQFSASAATKLFDQEIREVVLGTIGGLGAAGLSASLLTTVLETTAEDLLALGLCSAGGLLVISNYPARRKELVNKVNKVADSLGRELELAMQKDLDDTIGNLAGFAECISRPYQEATQNKLNYLLDIQKELLSTGEKLRTLQNEIQNIHIPQ
ncbi:probable transmembrane GTPase FZO-like, chloroplastic isoform X1 [Amborella trichopoda]|nr:probable transmembrane GTPase FZO-like, chloroplastic isoform X1 [Amborella trichopoda]|eukprot:XP_006851107.2 probable transmembrane GTPase FZO-like, chloroplastic isoform X1 [Amborella trichopoda]